MRRQINICFTARIVGGDLAISDESTELLFLAAQDLAGLKTRTQRPRLTHYLERGDAPPLG